MIDQGTSATVGDHQRVAPRLGLLLYWFLTRYNDQSPNPCPEPGKTEEEIAAELISAGLIEVGPLGEDAIPTPQGWRIVGDLLKRKAESNEKLTWD